MTAVLDIHHCCLVNCVSKMYYFRLCLYEHSMNFDILQRKNRTHYWKKKLKAENLHTSMKCLLKHGRQGNLAPYFLFKSNPWTTIVSCCSPANASDETDITTFFYDPFSLACKQFLLLVEFIIFTNPFARAEYDTRSIFKRSLTGFEFRVILLLD